MAKKQNNDQVILALKKQIELKKASLKKSEKFSPITNCSLFIDNERFNINVLPKETLIHLICKLSALAKAATELELIDSYIIGGFNIKDWITDLKSKYDTLNRKLEEERLKALEAKFHSRLTEETKTELEIDEWSKEI